MKFPPPPVPLMNYTVEADRPSPETEPISEADTGISIITAVMNRTDNLLQALPTWLQQPHVREVIIVDWSSRTPVADAIKQLHDPRICVLRVIGQKTWVLSWAMNLAARFARYPTLLKIDADVLLTSDFLARHPLTPGSFISGHFQRVGKGLGGLLFIRKRDFHAVNGFNEHIIGYGWDDTDLYQRLTKKGMRQRFFIHGTCTHIPHSDRMRLKHQKLRIPLRTVINLHNRLSFQHAILWNAVHNILECSDVSHPPVHIIRYRELDPAVYLQTLKNASVDYFRVSGNWGDSLLAEAGRQLLRKQDIPFREYMCTMPPKAERSATAVIKGGGGLIDLHHVNLDFLSSILGNYRHIILLPMTINGERQRALLQRMGTSVTIFCREKQSYDFVKTHWKHANTHLFLHHDIALQMNFAPYQDMEGEGVLHAWRTDHEQTDTVLPAENRDLSAEGNVSKPIHAFLRAIAEKRIIQTNRLHIAIAAACLGKEVILFPNSYYKNKAVYDYSLHQMPNVRWMENGKQ